MDNLYEYFRGKEDTIIMIIIIIASGCELPF